MKTLIVVISLIMSMTTFSQLEVTTSESKVLYQNIYNNKLVEFNANGHTFYSLYYRDSKYQYIVDIKYIPFDNIKEVNQFIDLSEKVLETKERFSTSSYSLSKTMGTVLVIGKDGGTFYMTKAILAKLKESLIKEE